MGLDSSPISLLLAIHAHQPVDNFDNVFSRAFESSYLPFFETLSRFPDIKMSFHISGSLLDWTIRNQAGFIKLIKRLIKKGQLELLAAGYYEPILVLLSHRDKINQIEMYISKIDKVFDFKPKGLWLTERVWESSLVSPIKISGIDFTIVDDEHFKRAGFNEERLDGYYITEDNNQSLAIFPSSKFLRYSLPFKLPHESIEYLSLKRDQGVRVISFGDDLEKFGFWPGTYDWVYKERWLNNLFALLSENKSWIKTAHFSDILKSHSSSGRAYLPSASYSEMMDWSGGVFKNFLSKYPESNYLHKRVFNLSQRLEALEDKSKKTYSSIREKLYKAQNNDVYWHGVFGGLYLTHLRYIAYKYLIDAEQELDSTSKIEFPVTKRCDLDLDGDSEIIFKDNIYDIYLSPAYGATIFEIDYKPANMNILNTIARREESYHQKIVQEKFNSNTVTTDNPSSIHDREMVATGEIKSSLIYDSYRKSSWMDHVYKEDDLDENALLNNEIVDILKLYENTYLVESNKKIIDASVISKNLSLKKSLKIDENILNFLYNIDSSMDSDLVFSSEFNMLLYSEDILKRACFLSVKELILDDSWFKLKYLFNFSKETKVFMYPIYTISDSGCGLERSYQGLSMHFIWSLEKGFNDMNFNMKIDRA